MLTPSRAAVDQQRLALQKVVDLAHQDLEDFWVLYIANSDPQTGAKLLMSFADELVEKYGDLSGTLAADFYDEARRLAGAPGAFSAAIVPADVAAMQASTRRLAGHLWTDHPGGALPGLLGVIDRLVKRSNRETTMQATRKDPAKPRFARVPSGSACPFCIMLGSRGFVYRSEVSAGVHNQFHSHCSCAVVPSWDKKNPALAGYDPDALYDQYNELIGDDDLGYDKLQKSSLRAKARHQDETNARERKAYHQARGDFETGEGYSSARSAAQGIARTRARKLPD